MRAKNAPASTKTAAATAAVVCALVALALGGAVVLSPAAPEEPSVAAEAAVPVEPEPEPESPGLSALDPRTVADEARSALDGASATDEVNLFDAAAGTERVLAKDEAPEIARAVAAFDEAGCQVGFVVYDLASQRGIARNADGAFFSASTVKAPFASYVVQGAVDAGEASLDEEIAEDVLMEGTGVMAFDDLGFYDLRTVIENVLVHSDNTGYALLRERFDREGFEAWCAEADVDAAAWEGEWYPSCTPRDLAKLWLNTGAYLAGDAPNAAWFKDALLRTQNSFLREALGGEGREVLAKPGYEIDMPGYSTAALNDAGVVFDGTGAYVVAIMSDADYDDEYLTENGQLIVDLAAALGAARDRLLTESEGS
ncbi:serine hydrolase [Arabiibacter massiliensis]|uniref:serine hydrolase n=1 Tax=Arabiibacter massiliensis TaxID=1870985 RepID=UPI0009BA5F40|nr:serine hydrolase [Arabiibacter massiliensis]